MDCVWIVCAFQHTDDTWSPDPVPTNSMYTDFNCPFCAETTPTYTSLISLLIAHPIQIANSEIILIPVQGQSVSRYQKLNNRLYGYFPPIVCLFS